jgi:hypothetical protein
MMEFIFKKFLAMKLQSININETGVVPFKGIAIYGVIFVSIFILSKLLINKIVEL